tara:strand:- start:1555 stop:2913 length:1359 start_codon:yes stop_codon:yes gene_type:complete
MPGGQIIQMVARGAQDVYLTGEPQITFFKVVYRRHTNFSIESVEQNLKGDIEKGKIVSCKIGRNGDLISRMYLEFETDLEIVPDTTVTTDKRNIATQKSVLARYYYQQAIEYVEIEIGGKKIDKHYGEWLDIWYTLTHDPMSKSKGTLSDHSNGRPHYVPLQFWFNRNPGLALPIISLQHHDVVVYIKFGEGSTGGAWSTADNSQVQVGDPVTSYSRASYKGMSKIGTNSVKLWVDYVFLDTEERKRFIQNSHEYLIEQTQMRTYNINSDALSSTDQRTLKAKMDFSHPVKELVWVVKDQDGYPTYEHDNIRILFNNTERFTNKSSEYFTTIQPYYHHTCMMNSANQLGIHVYSFALRPEENQPSGTSNFSRLDEASLIIGNLNANLSSSKSYPGNTMSGSTLVTGWWLNDNDGSWSNSGYSSPELGSISIYAVNYNILKVTSGMAGLVFSH